MNSKERKNSIPAGVCKFRYDEGLKLVSADEGLFTLIKMSPDEFAKEYGGIICRELLGLKPGERPVTKPRNTEYYKKRPCPEMVGMAGAILEEML